MQEIAFQYMSADGHTVIHALKWLPDQKNDQKKSPAAVIQVCHGLTEYIGRYREFADYFTKKGYVVAGNDILGHGESVDRKASASAADEVIHMERWEDAVRDCESLRSAVKKEYPGIPYYMLGFSLGSFLVRAHQIRYPGTADAVILAGTGQIPAAQLFAAGLLIRREASAAGWDRTTKRIHDLSFGSYNRHFAPNYGEFDWLYLDKECQREYAADERTGKDMSCGFFYQFLQCMRYTGEKIGEMSPRVPVLLISGSEDPVGGFGKGVRTVCRKLKKAGVPVRMELLAPYRHDIFHDACRYEVYEKIGRWLDEIS